MRIEPLRQSGLIDVAEREHRLPRLAPHSFLRGFLFIQFEGWIRARCGRLAWRSPT